LGLKDFWRFVGLQALALRVVCSLLHVGVERWGDCEPSIGFFV
jgi:hypothetical protein